MLKTLKLDLDCKIDKHDYLTIMQGFTYNYEFYVFDDGEAVDLTGVTVNIDFMKPDKKFIIKTSGISKDGNKLMFGSDLDYTNISGKAKMQVVLKKNYMVYGSWVIDVVIKPSAINDNDGQSENKLTITQELKDVIAKAEADIVSIPIEAEKKITELTNQANTSIDTLKTNTQKTLNDLTNQANTSINNVSTNADTKINALITKSNQTIANLEQAITNGDIESIKNEVFEKEYGTFTTNKSMASVGETTVTAYGITTLEEPMLEEDVTTTLEEPTEEENGIMTMEEPMLLADTAVEPIKTGIPKSATLKGQTLVNHLLKCKSNVTSASNVIEFALPMNVAKKYILKFRINSLPTLNESDYRAVKFEWYTGGTTGGYYNHFKQNVTIGKDEYVIIPPYTGEVTRTNFSIWSPSYESGTLDIDVAIFEYQDGMENWDIPYFTGMASVVNPSVTSVGKNLFDGEVESGSIDVNTGASAVSPSEIRTKNFILINGEIFTVSRDKMDGALAIRYYDENKSYIGSDSPLSINMLSRSYTPPITAKYLRFKVITTDTTIKYQVENGTQATTYEPYKTNILSTPSEVVLRSLPNGVCDTLNLITGEYVQRIGEVVYDGSSDENWKSSNNDNGIIRFNTTLISNLKETVDYVVSPLICDKYSTIMFSHAYSGYKQGIAQYKNTHIVINNGTSDLDEFKNNLNSNPITVQYELATPIVTTVDLTGLPFVYADGHILLSADSILPTYEYEVATTLKSQGENTAEELLDVKLNKLGKTEKASDSALLNGVKEDTSATGNTIVKRDSYGGAKFKNLTMNNNNSLYGTTTGGGTVNLAYLSNTNKTVYGAITNGMLLRSNTQPMLNINGTEKAIYSEHNLKIETGNFTPYIYGAKTNGNLTHSVQKGRYVKIGEMIYCHINVGVESGHGSLAGDVRIGGIPFIQNEDAVNSSVAIGYYRGIGSGKFQITACLLAWENFIRLYVCDASNTDWFAFLNDANLTDTGRIEFTLSFMMRTV